MGESFFSVTPAIYPALGSACRGPVLHNSFRGSLGVFYLHKIDDSDACVTLFLNVLHVFVCQHDNEEVNHYSVNSVLNLSGDLSV